MKLTLKFQSIRSRILIWLLSFVAVSLVVFSLIVYFQRVRAIKEREYSKLTAIRGLKVQHINAWVDNIIGDMKTLSSYREVRRGAAAACAGAAASGPVMESLDGIFLNYINNYDRYHEFFILSARTGKIVYSTSGEVIGENRSDNEYFTGALRNNELYIKDIYYSKNLNLPTMTFSIPLYGGTAPGSRPCAVLVGRIFLEQSLFALLQERLGMGKTGETLIVNRESMVLNRARGREGVYRMFRINDRAARLAIESGTGIVESRDYRNRKVLAAYTVVQKTGWGLIVKQDLDEIYRPIHQMLRQILLLLLISLALVSGIAIIISRNLSRPIRSLIDVSKKIQSGDLSARNRVERVDELSYLAVSINRMADSIVSELDFQRTCADLTEVMLSTIDLNRFSSNILNKMIEVTGSSIGAFYILSDDGREFKHLTSIGLDPDSIGSFHAENMEGEFGRALATRKITRTTIESESSLLRLRTVIGDLVPRSLITVPVIVNNRCAALISLASLSEHGERPVRIIEQIWLVLNAAFSNILAIEERRRLSGELQDKNRLLEMKKETLQHQAYELKRQTDMVKNQNRELEEQRRAVEEANRLKSEFLSNMSHELRTPLNSILALSRVLAIQSRDKLDGEELGYIEVIERNGRNLLALINDILDLSRIETGRIDLNPKSISLHSILNIIKDNFEQIAGEKGIGLVMDIDENLPRIVSDEQRIYQILQNIIGNAVKFTGEGEVSIVCRHENGHILVEVADTGIGISEEDLPHIFEEFRQIDGTLTRKYEGTGLGLAIASKSARLISARITAESRLGEGSRFRVYIPVEWNPDVPGDGDEVYGGRVEEGPYEPKQLRRQAPARGAMVLVVEDDPDNLFTLKSVLEKRFTVLSAMDGEEGLRMALEEVPDLILLDIALPQMSGFTVVEKLRDDENTRDIPVIAITALSMEGDRERILNAGCDDYISKPYEIETLMNTIDKWAGAGNE